MNTMKNAVHKMKREAEESGKMNESIKNVLEDHGLGDISIGK